jgi:signal transduction histidine kinase
MAGVAFERRAVRNDFSPARRRRKFPKVFDAGEAGSGSSRPNRALVWHQHRHYGAIASRRSPAATEKLAATGRLAASIAHEINNPLEAVTNLVYLARKQPLKGEEYLKLADRELDRIAQITRNTLGFYRDSASPTRVNISEVLEEVLALYARKLQFKKIALHSDYGAGVEILGYPGEIRQIFANLIANAIEALPEEGILTVRAVRATSLNGAGKPGVRITFLDTGSGIAPKDRRKIFEPFYTTKKDVGTGLGLWLTLGLVEKHNGSIRVRSSVQSGKTWTVFSVFLPERPIPIYNLVSPSPKG